MKVFDDQKVKDPRYFRYGKVEICIQIIHIMLLHRKRKLEKIYLWKV